MLFDNRILPFLTGEVGVIEGTFGTSGKFRVTFGGTQLTNQTL